MKDLHELNIIVMPNGSLLPEWTDTKKPANKSSRLLQEEIYRHFGNGTDLWLLFLGFCDQQVPLSPSLNFWRNFTGLFVKKLTRMPDLEILRHTVQVPLKKTELRQHLNCAPLMAGSEYLNEKLLKNVWARLLKLFIQSIKSYNGTVADFIKTYSPNLHLVGRVFFHLVENKSSQCPFAFMATYSTRLSSTGKSKHLPLKHAIQEFGNNSQKLLELLATVHLAANKSDLIANLIETGELFHPLAWTSSEAFLFLKEIPLYEESGILCRIPNWWKGNTSSIRINFSVGNSEPSFVNMNTILNFDASLYLGNTPISEKDAQKLLNESEGLAFIKNKWVAVDNDKLKQTLEAYAKARKQADTDGISLRDAIRLQLAPEKFIGGNQAKVESSISNGEWLKSVMGKLQNPNRIASVKPDKKLQAKLRDYQQTGLNWLYFLHSLQFGACMADDMGLGKTVQILAFLQILKTNLQKSKKPGPANLLIIPASLISNWENEINRFTPELNFFIAHPSANLKKNEVPEKKEIDAFDLVITTYALAKKYEWLQTYSWNYIILDEAQAIKNPGTKQANAIKGLTSRNRIIMTGTPIENRLSDLWSLFDFLNPGLLGTIREFKKFTKDLNQNASGYSKLRNVISPYILRRLKTDKTVISDLPEKIEMKTYAPLSKKQTLLYKNLVKDIKNTIIETEGIQRKGLILSALMKFKQLCNHPDQYLGTGDFKEKESGKFLRLREICETISEKREKLLVFTQFKEMTEPLHDFLETIFQRHGLILHGSIMVSKRKKLIAQFQSQNYVPFMVLSLKAGGVGLNLTEANHVIHFDRWWNPAVENQATDRAFRIGQKKNVIVHKFLTKGTVEEKIDLMLEKKSKLSEDIIASTSNAWITEMNNDELIDLLQLKL